MKYLAILFSLIFAMNAPSLADTAAEPEVPAEPELHEIVGVVTEVSDGQLLLDTATHGQVLVHLTEETLLEGEEPTVGAYVHVIDNGIMTMSLPPQVTALRVGCYAYSGTVSEITEESFLLTAEGTVYQVNAEPEKLAGLTDGQSVTVYSNGMMTMSIPGQIYGELIVAAE